MTGVLGVCAVTGKVVQSGRVPAHCGGSSGGVAD